MSKIPIILAIDFDMTIVNSHPYPVIKSLKGGAKKYINKLHDLGYYIIIWTCRTDMGKSIEAANAEFYLFNNGIKYHLFNENNTMLCETFGNNSRKIGSDYYVDDKGLWLFGIPSWFTLYWIIRIKSFFLKDKQRVLSHCNYYKKIS